MQFVSFALGLRTGVTVLSAGEAVQNETATTAAINALCLQFEIPVLLFLACSNRKGETTTGIDWNKYELLMLKLAKHKELVVLHADDMPSAAQVANAFQIFF